MALRTHRTVQSAAHRTRAARVRGGFGVRDPVAAWARGSQALITIGAALAVVLLVLWAYLSLRWAFATAAFVEHGYRGRAALRRSRELTSGHWLRLGAGIAALSVAAVLVAGVVQGLARSTAVGLGSDAGFTALALLIGLNFLLGLLSLLVLFVALNSLVLAAYCGAYPQRPTPLEARGKLGRAWTVAGLVAIAAAAVGVAGVVWTALLAARPVDPAQVELIAHRAGEAHAPENSLAAVRQARLDRADRLEFDVQRTADDRIVVIHDADLVRLSGQDVVVAKSTLQQVQAVDIGEGERVPTLEEFLDAAGNTPLALEVKTHPKDEQTTREVVALLQRRGEVPKTVLMSLDPKLTALARNLEPDLVTADLVSVAAGGIYLLPSDVIAPSDSLLSANLVFLAHTAGKRVWVWAVEDDALLREAVLRGVDGVIASDIPAARRVIEAMPEVSRADIVRDRVNEVIGASPPITSLTRSRTISARETSGHGLEDAPGGGDVAHDDAVHATQHRLAQKRLVLHRPHPDTLAGSVGQKDEVRREQRVARSDDVRGQQVHLPCCHRHEVGRGRPGSMRCARAVSSGSSDITTVLGRRLGAAGALRPLASFARPRDAS